MGLGGEYNFDSYGIQITFPRASTNSGDSYLYTRFIENGVKSAWTKISAGYADTAGSANQIDGVNFSNSIAGNPVNANSLNQNGIGYVNPLGTTLFSQGDGALYSQAHSDIWQHQIYGDYRSGQIAIRGKNNGTWQPWRAFPCR